MLGKHPTNRAAAPALACSLETKTRMFYTSGNVRVFRSLTGTLSYFSKSNGQAHKGTVFSELLHVAPSDQDGDRNKFSLVTLSWLLSL